MDAEELVVRYATGERDFAGVDLTGVMLRRGEELELLLERHGIEENYWVGGVELCGIDLSGANLERANLEGADFTGATLRGANLREAKLEVVCFQEADLSGANMTDALLMGSRLYQTNLTGTILEWANLGDVRLVGAILRKAKLRGADISAGVCIDSDFTSADIREAVSSFCPPKERCNFTKANWNRACIQQCNFFDCDFTKSSFSKTTIVAAHFIRCNFTDAKLKGVNAPEAYVKNSIRPSGKRARCWSLQPATPNPS